MDVPVQVRVQGALYIIGGALNLLLGWFISSMLVGTIGTVCTGILTLGFCPIGGLCGVVSWFIIPVAILELILGIVVVAVPEVVKPVFRALPPILLVPVLLGDFISPVLGLVSFGLGFTPEVQEWLGSVE